MIRLLMVFGHIVLLTTVCWLGADLFYLWIFQAPDQRIAERLKEDRPQGWRLPPPAFDRYQTIVTRNLFDTGQHQPATALSSPTEMAARSEIKLYGTVVGAAGKLYAVVAAGNGFKQRLVRPGDRIEGFYIKEITRQRVTFEHNGRTRTVQLTLPERKTMQKPAEMMDANETGQYTKGDIDKLWRVSDKMLQDQSIQAYYRNGKSDGIKFLSVEPESIWSRLGLEKGDVLLAVNGRSLPSIDRAVALFGGLQQGQQIKLKVLRNDHIQIFRHEY